MKRQANSKIAAGLAGALLQFILTSCSPEGAWDQLRGLPPEGAPNGPPPSGTYTVTLSATQDTDINSGTPTTNYGFCTQLITNRSGGSDLGNRRLLVQFDLSSLPPGAIIDSAELRLSKVGGAIAGVDFNIHRVTSQWDQGFGSCFGSIGVAANWNNRVAFTPWLTPGGDYDPAPLATVNITTDQEYTWSSPALLTVVRNWYQGPMNNFGFIGGSPDLGIDDRIFGSRGYSPSTSRPQLVVTYTLP
jgi:hypothetical protein